MMATFRNQKKKKHQFVIDSVTMHNTFDCTAFSGQYHFQELRRIGFDLNILEYHDGVMPVLVDQQYTLTYSNIKKKNPTSKSLVRFNSN